MSDARMTKSCCMLLVLGFLVAGCASHKPVRLLESNFDLSESELATVVDVQLIPGDPNRQDQYVRSGRGDNHTVITGPVWTRLFVGNEQSDATFSITSAVLKMRGDGMEVRYTYDVMGEMDCNGEIYPIESRGSRSATVNTRAAMSESVESAVLSAAQKAQFILNRCADADATFDLNGDRTVDSKEAYDSLIKLDDLRQKGILTDEEFEIQKRKVLSK